jgi:hypothetical protein
LPLWVTLPDSKLSNGTYSGDIYTTSGPPSTGPFDPSQVAVTKVGTASLTFAGFNSATLAYTAFGKTSSRPISPQPF